MTRSVRQGVVYVALSVALSLCDLGCCAERHVAPASSVLQVSLHFSADGRGCTLVVSNPGARPAGFFDKLDREFEVYAEGPEFERLTKTDLGEWYGYGLEGVPLQSIPLPMRIVPPGQTVRRNFNVHMLLFYAFTHAGHPEYFSKIAIIRARCRVLTDPSGDRWVEVNDVWYSAAVKPWGSKHYGASTTGSASTTGASTTGSAFDN